MEKGYGMENYKSLKYETMNAKEKNKIEDMLVKRLGKWKYSLDQLAQKIPNELIQVIKHRWESVTNIFKDIFEKTLKKLIQNLNKKEVKESLMKNEEQFTLKFNTCMILLKDIKYVVKETTITCKKIYQLDQPSDFVFHVDDKDDEDEEENIEIKDSVLDDFNLDNEEEEQEATR